MASEIIMTLGKLVDQVLMNQPADAKIQSVGVEATGKQAVITLSVSTDQIDYGKLLHDILMARKDQPERSSNRSYTINGGTYSEKELKEFAAERFSEFAHNYGRGYNKRIGVNGRSEWIVRDHGTDVFTGPMHDAIHCYNSITKIG